MLEFRYDTQLLIEGNVRNINVCGKCSDIWEKCADNICIEYENNGKKPEEWSITTEKNDLDFFISNIAFSRCEYYDDDEKLSHNPIFLFYDDENLKNFVIKRVEWFLEDTKTPNPHEGDKDCGYSKDFMLKEASMLRKDNKIKQADFVEAFVWYFKEHKKIDDCSSLMINICGY